MKKNLIFGLAILAVSLVASFNVSTYLLGLTYLSFILSLGYIVVLLHVMLYMKYGNIWDFKKGEF
ncbi:hypothetical protein [Adhaeribacter aquaticus]|uniref:hypothetical protein n=1 Tax=Adhaeribacter aquaticus TaxID=299567 RepID=UPI00041CCDCE|nr:hypothetical protein [Adhaeribacter aquaticus]